MTSKSSRMKRFFGKLLLVVSGVLTGALIAEIALRIAGYSDPAFYSLDHSRGYALRPNAEGWYRKEGAAYVRINSDGQHDRDHSLSKPADTIRIAVLGDSYPEALQVSMEEAFWHVMESRLQHCDAFQGKQIEVLNFGVSGYGTGQELLTLQEKVWKYSPDVVMLAVTTNNDVTDNSRVLKKTDEVPYFIYQNDRLTLDDSFKTSRPFVWRQAAISRFGRWLRNNSRVVQAVVQGHRGFKGLLSSWRKQRPQPGAQPDEAQPQADLLSRGEELGIDNLIYLEPSTAVWNDAWRVTEGLIVEVRNEVKSHGARFVVVTMSNPPQVLPEPGWRDAFQKRFGASDLFYPDNRIKSLGERGGFSVITLAPELQQFAERNHVFLHGFGANAGNGHWNVTGNRVAGELIAKKMCQGGVLK